MDRIELAERRFRQLPPVSAEDPQQRKWLRAVEIWLRDNVVAAVEEFIDRPAFQERARWPLRRLVLGADTPERRAVQAVDEALVAAARALNRVAAEDAIAHALAGASGTSWMNEQRDMAQHQAQMMAARPWSDLVCAHDYLEPRGGLMRTSPLPPEVTEGAFVLSLNPGLGSIGDFLTRCLFRRIDI